MKQFTKWFGKLLLLALIVAMADFGVGKIDSFIRGRDNDVNLDYLTRITSGHEDILIIGSSIASHHYIPAQIQDSLGLTCYNAGLDGAFFVFQNCAINYLLENNQPKYILWEIGEDCLSDNIPKSREYQKMNLLYPYYSNEYIHHAVDSRDCWQKYRMLSKMYCANSNMIHDVLSVIDFIRNRKPTKQIGREKKLGYVPLENNGYDYPAIECDSAGEYVNPEKLEMLRNTIIACKKHDVQLIFTSSPRHYDADLLSSLQSVALRRFAEEEGIPYIDFYNFESISDNNTYFKDCDHLNARGAEAYMEVFIPEIKKIVAPSE